jgi:hypothetical protein
MSKSFEVEAVPVLFSTTSVREKDGYPVSSSSGLIICYATTYNHAIEIVGVMNARYRGA